LRLVAVGLGITAALVFLAPLSRPYLGVENLLWHVYTIVQTLFFGGLYVLVFRWRWQQRLVQLALAGFLAFALLDWFWLEQGASLHAYTHSLQGALLVGLGGLYLRQLAHEMPVTYLGNHSLFLVSSGLVMYFSGTVLLYVFAGHFVATSDLLGQHVVSMLVSFVNLVQLTLFTLAFHRAPRLLLLSVSAHD